MHFRGTCLCLLASMVCCSGQGSGGDHGHEDDRFTVTVGELLTFDDARAFCGPDKYLLSLHTTYDVSHVQATLQRHGLGSSYVWLNMRMIQGFFHWLDPVPQLFRQKYNSAYGNEITSYSFHHGCAVLNTSVGSIETRPCDDKHQFLCIQDNLLRPRNVSDGALSVELRSDQSPILLSGNLPDLRLTCRAKSRNGMLLKEEWLGNYAYAHVWTKNGIFLDNTYPSLQPEKASELNAYIHSSPSSQGRYRCGLKALPSGRTVWSNVITVVLEDYDTYRLTGHLPATVDPGPIQFVGSSFAYFARGIQMALNRQQDIEILMPQQEAASLSYSGLTIDDMNRINISIFVYYQRAELASLADGETREQTVFNDSIAIRDLLVINNITDVVHCDSLQQGTFAFHSEGHVGFIESTPQCLTESNKLVSRSCDINFESKPTWGAFNESTCKAGTDSRVFDVHTDTHHLLCSPHHCVPKNVNGTWLEVSQQCKNMGGYLASAGPGSWTDIVRKHGHLQSDSAAHPEVLEALQMSELLPPIVLPVGLGGDSCFIVSPVQHQLQSAEETIMQTSCSDTLEGRCAFRQRSFFRGMYS
ncbi:uncharacterized protein LOC119400987 [Rhipicephalus sanguineus]|uniref:uncharacterized protein LOC119400987 n=1 Tax=Rhipicephalus sanguineus TaxID=34632 RepID=UPI0020C32FCA|nr:uncharacterized protein LOC119400987 [Rhipicephalus sanguineus]